jgi:hypothetical protein
VNFDFFIGPHPLIEDGEGVRLFYFCVPSFSGETSHSQADAWRARPTMMTAATMTILAL